MKHRDFKHVVKDRKLTEDEAMEEEIYKLQLIESWGWRPGKSPEDIIRKKKEEE